MRILLVDDHPLTREGLRKLIEQHPGFEVCGEADSAAQALEAVGRLTPSLAIVDISLKATNGLELTKGLHALMPEMPILVVSMYDEEVYAERALRAGALGYLMKRETSAMVTAAIEQILRGEIFVSDRIKGRMLQQFVHLRNNEVVSPIEKLSDREMEVLQLIGNGYGTREIASILALSVKTIDSYREHLKEKLGMPSSSDLVRFAIQWMKSQPS